MIISQKIKFSFFLSAILLFLLGCKKEDDDCGCPHNEPGEEFAELRIEIVPVWGDQEFILGQPYDDHLGQEIRVSDLIFYLAEIEFTDGNGNLEPASEIALFNLNDGPMNISTQVKKGNYTGVNLAIGVPHYLNGTNDENFDPSQYGPDHPLSVLNGTYWEWEQGYRFVTFQGRCDTIGGTPLEQQLPFSFHTGRDQSYRSRTFDDVQFSVGASEPAILKLEVDVSGFLNAVTPIDLKEENMYHGGLSNLATSEKLMDNVAASVRFIE